MTTVLIFIATVAVGVRFNLPRNMLWLAAGVAAGSYCAAAYLHEWGASSVESAFVGAFLVAMTSELLARRFKVPSPVLSTPGIIPLVPGSLAYRGVIHLVSGREVEGVATATKVVLTAVGIASGLLLASALSRTVLKPVFSIVIPEDEESPEEAESSL